MFAAVCVCVGVTAGGAGGGGCGGGMAKSSRLQPLILTWLQVLLYSCGSLTYELSKGALEKLLLVIVVWKMFLNLFVVGNLKKASLSSI